MYLGSVVSSELPCSRAAERTNLSPNTIVSGYVSLDGIEKPDFGKYLYGTLDQAVEEIVDVAKKLFTGIRVFSEEYAVFRCDIKKLSCITKTGELEAAKQQLLDIFGKHKVPALA